MKPITPIKSVPSARSLTPTDRCGLPYLTDEYDNRTTVRGIDDQPFQYTGEQVDAETGFVYLRARYYDPGTGRFVSRDQVSGTSVEPAGQNRYAYSGDNPINFSDPTGHQISIPLPEPQPPVALPRAPEISIDWRSVLAAAIAGDMPDTREREIDTYVVRGGTSTADRFTAGATAIDDQGILFGVSVQMGTPGTPINELARYLPNKQIGVSTLKIIRTAGGDVMPDPLP